MADMRDIWKTDGGLYLGQFEERPSFARPSAEPPFDESHIGYYTDERHVLTLGPNGSGKSRRSVLVALRKMLMTSMLVIDPKGEHALATAQLRRNAGNDVIILNPFNVHGLGSDGFNPLANLDISSDEFADDAMGLAESIIQREGNGEPHWANSAQDFAAADIMYSSIYWPQEGMGGFRRILGQSSSKLRDMVANPTVTWNGATTNGMLATADFGYEALGAKIGRYADLNDDSRELQGILSTALTQTRWLDSTPIKRDLKGKAFDFAQMKQKPTTVYLILPATRMQTHAGWLRLVLTSAFQALMRDGVESKVPVYFVLDEFAQLGRLPVIEQNIALMRGYGLKLWAILQDLAQVEHLYKDRWQSFLANAGVLQFFAPQDTLTADFISKYAGQTMRDAFHVGDLNAGAKIPISANKTPMPTILPQELRRMGRGWTIVFSDLIGEPAYSFLRDPDQLPRDYFK